MPIPAIRITTAAKPNRKRVRSGFPRSITPSKPSNAAMLPNKNGTYRVGGSAGGAPGAKLVVGAVVVTLTVTGAASVPSSVIEETDVEHVAFAGAPLHETATLPLKPSIGVSVTV